MAIIAEFELQGSPKLINAIGRKHWGVKVTESRLWKSRVISECCKLKIDHLKLKKAKLTLIRKSCKACDFDGLVSSFKHVIDGLVASEVIVNDSMSIIGQPSYTWEYRRRALGGVISIKIESVE